MKAILIDPKKQTIEEMQIEAGLKPMYDAIGCDLVTAVSIKAFETLWLDDEGLFKEELYTFTIGNTGPFVGRGLVIGVDCVGESISTQLSIEEIRNSVQFIGEVYAR